MRCTVSTFALFRSMRKRIVRTSQRSRFRNRDLDHGRIALSVPFHRKLRRAHEELEISHIGFLTILEIESKGAHHSRSVPNVKLPIVDYWCTAMVLGWIHQLSDRRTISTAIKWARFVVSSHEWAIQKGRSRINKDTRRLFELNCGGGPVYSFGSKGGLSSLSMTEAPGIGASSHL